MKKLFAGLFTMLALGAFADANDVTIYVWTNGPDKYADGTTVLDGERYALVWSAGEFAGFQADGALVNASDRVLEIAALAKNGKCSDYIFAIPYTTYDTELKGGNFYLYLLDTRVFAEDGSSTFAAQESMTKISAIAGSAKVGATIKVSALAAQASAKAGEVTASETALPADAPASAIKSFRVDSAAQLAYIEVENTAAYLRYGVESGEAPDKLADDSAAPRNGNGGTITIVKPVTGDSGFFKVIRK